MIKTSPKFTAPTAAVIALVVLTGTACAASETFLYKRAVNNARRGNPDFAYMDYRLLLREHPNTRYREQVDLAMAEYMYQIPSFAEAKPMFERYLSDHPETEAKLFILAYLYHIAQAKNDAPSLEKYRKEIIDCKQVSLVFRDRKEYMYTSPLGRQLKAVFSIDNIEFSVNGELLTKISY